jgi:hypothetical protein
MVDTGTGQVCNPYGVWSWRSYVGYQRIDLSAGIAPKHAIDLSAGLAPDTETHTASINDIQSVGSGDLFDRAEVRSSIPVGAPIPPCGR